MIAKACLTDPQLNPTFAGLIFYYGPAASPARPRKPHDKAKVENAVLQVECWVLVPLCRRLFYSLAEVNRVMRPLMGKLNRRSSKHLGASRLDLFEWLDLPSHPWEFARWKQCRVDQYCHVSAGGECYSVPSCLIRRPGPGYQIRPQWVTKYIVMGCFPSLLM